MNSMTHHGGRRRSPALISGGRPRLASLVTALVVLVMCISQLSSSPSSSDLLFLSAYAQSAPESAIPIAGSGSLSYSSAPSLFPDIRYLDASSTIVPTTTVAPTTTTAAGNGTTTAPLTTSTAMPTTTTVETTTTTTTAMDLTTDANATTDDNQSITTNTTLPPASVDETDEDTNVTISTTFVPTTTATMTEAGTTTSSQTSSTSRPPTAAAPSTAPLTTPPPPSMTTTQQGGSTNAAITSTTTVFPTTSTAPPLPQWIDYCRTRDAINQLRSLCEMVFGVTGVSGFGTREISDSWGVASDGVSRGGANINQNMYSPAGALTPVNCETTLVTDPDNPTFRYVAKINFECACNTNYRINFTDNTNQNVNNYTFPQLPPLPPGVYRNSTDGDSVAVIIDTHTAATSKVASTMVAIWRSGYQSSPRGAMCEPRTGRCPNITALWQQYNTDSNPTTNPSRSPAWTQAFGCSYLLQLPYPLPMQNYFQDCTPRTLKCQSSNVAPNPDAPGVQRTTFTFTCPLCKGGMQTYTFTLVTDTSAVGSLPPLGSGIGPTSYLQNCSSFYFPPTGSRDCEKVAQDCNGNGCCRSDENLAAGGFSVTASTCACFDNDFSGHYVGAACERCNSRYTFCTDSSTCQGGATGLNYYRCGVDQTQIVALLADLSTSGMAMTMPVLLMLGVFIFVGLIRSSWESDQEFEMTKIRHGGCNIVSGKLASLKGVDARTRARLHLAIDRKVIPDRPMDSSGMVQRRRLAMAACGGNDPIMKATYPTHLK